MVEARPRLHRYCARMVGSVFDGEDVLQETQAKATAALSTAGNLRNGEGWLFTIAHIKALDSLRRRKRRAEVLLEDDAAELPNTAPEADSWVAATASLLTLMQLPVLQRAAVVLVDVLEYSKSDLVEALAPASPRSRRRCTGGGCG